jgi:DNA polymerase I-like protein with 3'-5' exonuclease and polymerase domains
VDQMTEASYMKTKQVELHKRRKETGFLMRITNHDELVGDIQDRHHANMVDEILNKQSFPQLRVPLTWSTGIGPNWAETS